MKSKRGGRTYQSEKYNKPQVQTTNELEIKIKKVQKQKYLVKSHSVKIDNSKKLLLIPGEEYDFDEKLIHYDAFGYANGNLVSKRAGVLLMDEKDQIKDQSNEEVFRSLGKYYSPKVDDPVIGIIVQKSSEFYKVDINSYTHAILNTKDFEGATKKQKPNLNLGDIVFARVSKVNKFDTPMLSCINPLEHKNWASGESYFGNIKGGNLFDFDRINTWGFYKDNYVLNRLNDMITYEIIIGFNGKMWINSDSAENIYAIHDLLMKSLKLSEEETEKEIHNTFINKIKE
jgi:exosome complex component RRP40